MDDRKKRFEKAIKYLENIGLIDAKDVVKDITDKTERHPNNIRGALRGEERFLTLKFIKTFCATYENIVSADWIWEGKGEMLGSGNPIKLEPLTIPKDIDEMEKSQLVNMLASIVDTYNKILDNNRLLHEHLKICEEIARRDQENFKYLMEQITRQI